MISAASWLCDYLIVLSDIQPFTNKQASIMLSKLKIIIKKIWEFQELCFNLWHSSIFWHYKLGVGWIHGMLC